MGKEKYLRKYYLKKISNLMETIHPQVPKIDKSSNMNKTTARHSTITLTGKGQSLQRSRAWLQRMVVMVAARGLEQVMGTDWAR